jgi:SAM-dependent methyltransferase
MVGTTRRLPVPGTLERAHATNTRRLMEGGIDRVTQAGPFAMDDLVTIEGFRCYAPALARGSADYPSEYFDRLYHLEATHFWFLARNRIIMRAFRHHLKRLARPRVLEVGCGTGYVLQSLATENRYDLTGLESHIAGLRFARSRLPAVELVQADARSLPYESAFDAVGAFDVIEHIVEDDAVLASVCRALKPGGIFVATVPQHMWLWSPADVQALHKRRYTRRQLSAKLRAAGFDILRCSSFVTMLLPVLYASRLAKRRRSLADCATDDYELEISGVANALCSAAMRVDEALIGMGLSLPVGGSLLAVARKKGC